MFSTDLLLCMGFYKWVNSRLFQRFLFVFNIYSQKKKLDFLSSAKYNKTYKRSQKNYLKYNKVENNNYKYKPRY